MSARRLDHLRAELIARGLEPSDRLLFFCSLPEDEQATHWRQLASVALEERFLDGDLDEPRPQPKSNRLATVERHGPVPRRGERRHGDVLETVSPVDYWEPLRGESLIEGRGRCPMPAHPDEHPSVVVYPDPGRGWWCPVCDVGGSAIDLAAAITGIEPRGRDYFRLRKWIAERLLIAPIDASQKGEAA